MAVKLARYVFKRIRGRIVPIRIGAKPNAGQGSSGKAMRKLKTILKDKSVEISKKGVLRKKVNLDATDLMDKFMRQTGSVRVSKSDALSIDPQTLVTDAQKRVLSRMSDGGEIFTERSSTFSFSEAIRRATQGKPKIKKTKIAEKLINKAKKQFGITESDDLAGFVLPSGEKLDFSGGGGQRFLDHRAVASITSNPKTKKIGSKELNRILKQQQRTRKAKARNKHNK